MNTLQALRRNLDLPLQRAPFTDGGNRRYRKREKLQNEVLAEKEEELLAEEFAPREEGARTGGARGKT